jgi:flagellar biosynthesis protein
MSSPKELRTAVALAYSAGGSAPKVVATGKGMVADRIIEMAKQHGVFVHASPELVALLMNVDLDDRIPPNLYRVVAELLAWLYGIEAALPPQDMVVRKVPS